MTFVQMIRAPLRDEGAVWQRLDEWERELRPEASGFLGSTAGVTTDGQFVLVARFEDESAAARNNTRPEQGEWWSELEGTLSGPATFFDSSEVDLSMDGGSDDAGFVQIMIGTGQRDQVRDAISGAEEILRKERPDILGGFTAWSGDRFFDVAYFTSEAEARVGETKELSEEGRAVFEQFGEVLDVAEYLDIPNPRFT